MDLGNAHGISSVNDFMLVHKACRGHGIEADWGVALHRLSYCPVEKKL